MAGIYREPGGRPTATGGHAAMVWCLRPPGPGALETTRASARVAPTTGFRSLRAIAAGFRQMRRGPGESLLKRNGEAHTPSVPLRQSSRVCDLGLRNAETDDGLTDSRDVSSCPEHPLRLALARLLQLAKNCSELGAVYSSLTRKKES